MRNEEVITIFQAPVLDQRIARCRHSRLREALQFRKPGQGQEAKVETPQPRGGSSTPNTESPLTIWERAALGLVKGILSLLVGVATLLTQPISSLS